MAERDPIAFLSYVRSDDAHDNGNITRIRERLEGEIRMQTGRPFQIFQDRNDISWGQHWESRLNESIANVTFLIPIVTPTYFNSPACRKEFEAFRTREKTLGLDSLILPLYYVETPLLEERVSGKDEVLDTIASRNWADWREYRFKSFADEQTAKALANFAKDVAKSLAALDAIVAKEKEKPIQLTPPPIPMVIKRTRAKATKSAKVSTEIVSAREMLKESKNPALIGLGYYAFTKAYDEIIRSDELMDPEEAARLYAYVAKRSGVFADAYGPHMESSVPEKLPPSTAITLLVDNSGSLRGEPITHVAAWCALLVEWLSRLQIDCEVLGFTTRTWKGGRSREDWLADKKPKNPGRLNDLRHIIYKSFSDPAISSVTGIGLMAREGLLKENVDGEALLWAYERLKAYKARNKALIVISDGAPVDDSTLSVNDRAILENHLLQVIDQIADEQDIFLGAVGIRYDVSRYYEHSASSPLTEEVGLSALKVIGSFLSKLEP